MPNYTYFNNNSRHCFFHEFTKKTLGTDRSIALITVTDNVAATTKSNQYSMRAAT